jgi:hypothetical protein
MSFSKGKFSYERWGLLILRMNYQKRGCRSIFKQVKIYLGLLLIFTSLDCFSQIPKRAVAIADSISMTRLVCPNAKIQLEDSIYYPIFKNEYQDRKTESYFFTYQVKIKEDLVTDLHISIQHDFSIKYVNGLPDSSYKYSPCEILPRERLWNKAQKKGLKTKFSKCSYSLFFTDDRIIILLNEKKSRWNVDHYSFDAVTGEYLGHRQMNLNF